MSNNKELILDPAMKRMQMEALEKIELHLDEGSKQLSVWAGYFETALRELMRDEGVPDLADEGIRAEYVQRADLMATAAAKLALRKRAELTAEVVTDLKVKHLPDHITWAAKRVGVEVIAAAPAAGGLEPVIKSVV